MRVFNNINQVIELDEPIVSIGSFDGLHRGHKSLIDELKLLAKKNNTQELIISFEPHPQIYFQKSKDFKLLTTTKEKIIIFEKQGIQNALFLPFHEELVNKTTQEFIKEILSKKLNAKTLLLGYDNKFGKDARSDLGFIKRLCADYSIEVKQAERFLLEGKIVSSSQIRTALNEGEMTFATNLLGYHYFINGRVVHGKKTGKKIGYPTANIEVIGEHKLIPSKGVYAMKIERNGKLFKGMGSIGNRPTVNGDGITIEAHIFNFSENIYEEIIKISFVEKLRNEFKFDSLEALQQQIHLDKKNTLSILK